MPVTISLEVEDGGLSTFDFARIERRNELMAKLRATNEQIAHEAIEMLTAYPPPVPGNFPPPPYWERGVGMINGAGDVIEPSMQYGNSAERWQYKTNVGTGEVVTIASTEIPYAPYLGDDQFQARWHEGWMTDEEVKDRIEPRAAGLVDATIQAHIAGQQA